MVGGRLLMPQCTYRECGRVGGQPCIVYSLIPPYVSSGDGSLVVCNIYTAEQCTLGLMARVVSTSSFLAHCVLPKSEGWESASGKHNPQKVQP